MHPNPSDLIAFARDHLPNLLDGLLTEALLALLKAAWQALRRHQPAKLPAAKEAAPVALPPAS